ncbi:hypothetical protein KUL42_33530 [Alteromonas sp. KUL42]|uniref:substrate-binding periplasmic protein n=1 Tax=Alteromonas sp. KUL42 TaxID=2480797 RepID=UPI0010358FBA|nr:ABC transporter substrate-binding protein [Alteromonas sp. KUL42]TAP33000.1 ABC transporter substrate-binding protein [Alteromonas sp. KUL42]GEA08592.1 hypothetical protein KUL42_33530 [Alteromonas sp. KUL42]
METARGISSGLVTLILSVIVLCSVSTHTNAKELSYANVEMPALLQEQQKALSDYAERLLLNSISVTKIKLIKSKATSPSSGAVEVALGVLRTVDNEHVYHWLTPIYAFDCSNLPSSCTPNSGSQPIKVGVVYVTLKKAKGTDLLAEQLSELLSVYKSTNVFLDDAEDVMSILLPHYPEILLDYGAISLVGKLDADTSDLWVIADHIPLFSELGERGKVEGIAADLVRDILLEVDRPSDILSAPWMRIAKEAMSKSNVLVFSVVRTEERDDVFHWITPVSRNLHGLFGINKPYFDSLNDVPKSYKVGTLLNDYRYNVALDNGFNVRAYESWHDLVEAVFKEEVDVLFGSQGAVDFGCDPKVFNCEMIKLTGKYEVSTAYLALSKKDTCLLVLEKLKLAAVTVRKSEKYNQQLATWSEKVERDHGIAHHTENGVVHLWNTN